MRRHHKAIVRAITGSAGFDASARAQALELATAAGLTEIIPLLTKAADARLVSIVFRDEAGNELEAKVGCAARLCDAMMKFSTRFAHEPDIYYTRPGGDLAMMDDTPDMLGLSDGDVLVLKIGDRIEQLWALMTRCPDTWRTKIAFREMSQAILNIPQVVLIYPVSPSIAKAIAASFHPEYVRGCATKRT